MTDVDETAEDEVILTAVEDEDLMPLILRSWGLSGEPVSWADVRMQPVIVTIRLANTGFTDLSAVQDVLDATYPDAGYLAGDVALAHPPTAEFVISAGDIDPDVDPDVDEYIDIIRVDLVSDEDLVLSDEHVVWDFGDGTPTHSDLHGYEHGYREPGTYTVTCTIPVAGVVYSTALEYTVGDEEPVVETTNNPAYLEREATTFDDPEDPPEEPPLGNAFPNEPVNPSEPTEPEEDEGPYDPAAHTVAEVLEYMDAHPDEATAIIEAESAGKGRVGITG